MDIREYDSYPETAETSSQKVPDPKTTLSVAIEVKDIAEATKVLESISDHKIINFSVNTNAYWY